MALTKKQVTVKYGDKEATLNRDLIEKQKAHKNIEGLKHLHKIRMMVETTMEAQKVDNTEDIRYLKEGDQALSSIDFMLQHLWGFQMNDKFHRFWERPRCGCPKMDNDDRYPTGVYVIGGQCILHGGDIK